MKKPKLIIFEGLDKTGKSTLISMFAKKTNFKYWALDRGVLSCLIYDEVFSRGDHDEYIKILKRLKRTFDLRIIYVIADYNLIRKRLKNNNEVLPDELQNLYEIDTLFRNYLKKYHLNYIEVNTTKHNVYDCVNYIIKYLEG